jgi:hypothetical protein
MGCMNKPYVQGFKLDDLIRCNAFEHKEAISEITGVASGEYALELQLEKVTHPSSSAQRHAIRAETNRSESHWATHSATSRLSAYVYAVARAQVVKSWAETEFTVISHRESRDVFIIGSGYATWRGVVFASGWRSDRLVATRLWTLTPNREVGMACTARLDGACELGVLSLARLLLGR